jgi:hypothetical protein
MGLKFVDDLPARTRAASSKVMTDEAIAELKDNPGKWALIQEKVNSAQTVANFVNKPENKEAWVYQTRTVETKKGKTKDGKEKTDRIINVYVAYDPEGTLRTKKK